MRFCYADPPYLGTSSFGAAHHYGALHEAAADYDRPEAHAALVARLADEFPDGWALSLHSPSLRTILPMCPEGVRVMPWVKPFASFKPGVPIAYAWEPVIVWGGRKRTREQPTVRDWVSCNIAMKKGFPGAKPAAFCYWLLDVLNVQDGDEVVDLFPGSGAVSWAIAAFHAARRGEVHEAPLWEDVA